ncbi:hypothetical protein WIK_00467 [Escherichia coli KTE122]|nr:hypothetical protein WIK_00467 [Escherichia coli KTE122]
MAQKLCDIYSSIGCALSSFRSPLGPPFDFLFDTCSCQTARCFNKSKGVLITGSKLKAFRNPQPSWGFSVHKKTTRQRKFTAGRGFISAPGRLSWCRRDRSGRSVQRHWRHVGHTQQYAADYRYVLVNPLQSSRNSSPSLRHLWYLAPG